MPAGSSAHATWSSGDGTFVPRWVETGAGDRAASDGGGEPPLPSIGASSRQDYRKADTAVEAIRCRRAGSQSGDEPFAGARALKTGRLACIVPFAPASVPQGSLGFILPTFAQDGDPWSRTGAESGHRPGNGQLEQLASWCRSAEELGAGTLWACDHLFWHGPCLECMVSLTVAATATSRVGLGTCVMQLPLRRASVVAKQAATLQVLSGGRFTLGVGVGQPPRRVRPRRASTTTPAVGCSMTPSPSCAAAGRVGSGASSNPLAYRQLPGTPAGPGLGRWIVGGRPPAGGAVGRRVDAPLRRRRRVPGRPRTASTKEVERAGRPAGAVTPAMVLFVSVDPDPEVARRRGTQWMSSLYRLPPEAFERHLVAGTAAEVAAGRRRLPGGRSRARDRLRHRR